MAVYSETLVGKFHNGLFCSGCVVVLMELSDKLLVLFALLDMFLGLMTFCECR
jgi:hypothetical protein